MENSKISWTDHTFNPWIGCTKVSPGCEHCYAEALDHRFGGSRWGKDARRTLTKTWNDPVRWNRHALKEGIRKKVFCASLADVFDSEVPAAWRDLLFKLIKDTPNLDWQLLTKRPGVAKSYLEKVSGWPWDNVWLGVTVEDQQRCQERIPILQSIPAKIRFLSAEPLLEAVSIINHLKGIDWVICGGESGSSARPFHETWATSLYGQCRSQNVAFFLKQLGSVFLHCLEGSSFYFKPNFIDNVVRIKLKDPKGSNPEEWASHLRVRQFPQIKTESFERI